MKMVNCEVGHAGRDPEQHGNRHDGDGPATSAHPPLLGGPECGAFSIGPVGWEASGNEPPLWQPLAEAQGSLAPQTTKPC